MCGPGKKYLNDLPSDGVLGVIEFSVTDSGYVKRHIFLLILKDIVAYCLANNISFPIVLFVDGYGGHFHRDISEFCRENKIVLLGKFIIKPKSESKVPNNKHIKEFSEAAQVNFVNEDLTFLNSCTVNGKLVFCTTVM